MEHRDSDMRHIELNKQREDVKRFFLSLRVNSEASVVVLDGEILARVEPVSAKRNGKNKATGPWTDAKNQRRADLIDKKIAGTIMPEESAELEDLQGQMLAYRRKVAPLPLEDVRRLHQELLSKAKTARKR
jgi:hypothetical protein